MKYIEKYWGDYVIIKKLEEVAEASAASMGNKGGKYISNTNATTPDTGYVFNAIQVVTDCVITCVGNITGITAVAVKAGNVVYGRYTSITLASGSVIAYYGEV